jgi:glutamate synthase domain-containing protein 3
MIDIDAKEMYYRDLNRLVRQKIKEGEKEIRLKNVNGQYYICDGVKGDDIKVFIEGVPGNDLCAFMDGPTVVLSSNGQDNIGNTMTSGKIIVNGIAGDVCGYAMRGGKLFVKGDAGYRIGIHMKGYKDKNPVIIIGGKAGDFFGEYMAGGILILLGLNVKDDEPIIGDYIGTGMHGGVIYIRGNVDKSKCGKEVGIENLNETDKKILEKYLTEFCEDFSFNINDIMSKNFLKLIPKSSRPYGALYAK